MIQSIRHDVLIKKYAKACKKPSILMTKQPALNLRINPQEIIADRVGDRFVLSVDKTLNPDFLKSLLNIKGDVLKKVTQIKDKMLPLMGYDPDLVKVQYAHDVELLFSGVAATFDPRRGTIDICPLVSPDNANLIAITRHELDHLDKIAKIVKSIGINEYKKLQFELIKDAIKQSDEKFWTKISALIKYPMKRSDKKFWTKISANARTEGFDADKYLVALKEHPQKHRDSLVREICHYNNELEKSAYTIESRILSVLSPGKLTERETFPCGYKNIERMLSDTNISASDRKKKFDGLLNMAKLTGRTNTEKLYKLFIKRISKPVMLTEIENMQLDDIILKNLSREQYQQCFKQVDGWLAQGITKIEDIAV